MQVRREAWDELISPTMTNNSPKSDSKSNKKSDEVGRVDTGMGESDIGMVVYQFRSSYFTNTRKGNYTRKLYKTVMIVDIP